MYINLKQTQKYLIRGDLELLTAIKQVDTEYLNKELTETDLSRFEALEFIERVKTPKKGQTPLRLTKKAKNYLNEISYEGSVDDETNVLADWLIGVYKNKPGGIVKNKTEFKRRLMWFKTITQISGNFLAVLLQAFISDTYNDKDGLTVREFMEQNPRGVLNNMLDILCWNPPNHFARNYTLADSPLYIYYENNQAYIEEMWAKTLDENGNRKK